MRTHSTLANLAPSNQSGAARRMAERSVQIVAVARIGIRIRAGHMQHAGTTQHDQALGYSSSSGESSTGGSTERVSDGCP